MSRAFVNEEAAEAAAAVLPEKPVSAHPNLVTSSGLRLIDEHVARLQAALAGSGSDGENRPRLARDLRYWRARRMSAQVVEAPPRAPQEVAFGAVVTVRRDGTALRYRIVGEDEADPAKGLLSWTSPLAKALLGTRIGETVEVGGDRPPVVVEGIERG
ncbi:MAG: GreA/GreB family elongation factor [Acetobacteraceae bacterium]|nr:GreA/GreB family elongation factor [Acetobacteraceae bacterium]